MSDDPLLAAPHCAFFCEENVWHLCDPARLGARGASVLFITNPGATVAVAHQCAGGVGGLVVWDYHVVLLLEDSLSVVDPDSTLPTPMPAAQWLRESFAIARERPRFAPYFARLPAERYRSEFRSDRSHMRERDGAWKKTPPPWPPIEGDLASSLSLDALRSMDESLPWLTLEALETQLEIEHEY